jgi:hypothetical protein
MWNAHAPPAETPPETIEVASVIRKTSEKASVVMVTS